MGTGKVNDERTFPMNVLDETGNQTGETVSVSKVETTPGGDTLLKDAEGNLYISKQRVQKLGGAPYNPDAEADEEEEAEEEPADPEVTPPPFSHGR